MNVKPIRHVFAWIGVVLAATAPLHAQTPARVEVPAEEALELFEFFNRAETIRMMGESRIARDAEVNGDLAVLGGPLHVAGRVRGRVVVLNGDARLEPGAQILGDLTVVGGVVIGLDSATVAGEVRSYREPLRYRLERDRIVPAPRAPEPALTAVRDFGFGSTGVTLAAHRGYNRVEGLPVVVGPRFESHSANPLRAEAFLIYRTASGFDPDANDLGYLVRLEQYVGGHRVVRLGATLHSEIVPIEAWGVSDRENSLSTFVLRRDYRDHYEREGWSAYLRVAPPGGRYDVSLGYRDERHGSVTNAEPWALFGDDDAWRPLPRVAEGRLRSLVGRVGYDTRNEGEDPTTGWYIQGELEHGIGGTLHRPELPQLCDLEACEGYRPGPVETEFSTAFVDVRRYARLSPTSRLALRAVAGMSLNDRPLPPQRQHVLGGEGSLPGYDAFAFDCGARDRGTLPDGMLPYYGCDRMALVQIEYRSRFPFGRGWGRKLGRDIDLGELPEWVVFFDVGRAWTEQGARDARDAGLDDFAAGAGAGLRFGPIGLYWAVPLSGHDDGINFFVRIGTRL